VGNKESPKRKGELTPNGSLKKEVIMPTKMCSICKRLQNIPSSEWRYIDKGGPFVCSKKCAIEWAVRARLPKKYMMKAVYLERERGSQEYSDAMRMWFRSKYELFVAEELYHFGFKVRFYKE